ncbi:hypothetical protein CKO51_01715 [Rhodopirellula sp. SM50]|nr:glycosyltransferase [Rhodopirellula sp. SM50]PAY21321.1 hypothetical protein CKO51_01715 [Rhodopirellula sp. SM50]
MMNLVERRMLLISYAYPPTGGGGVQRSVKFAKYLPQYSWRPTVLTAADPSVPVRDNDLSMELDPQTTVLRARTLEPSYRTKQKLITTGDPSSLSFKRWMKRCIRKAGMSLLQPDPQILWNPYAARLATQTLRQIPHAVVYVTGPPFSSFLLGRTLKRRFGLPLVLDFRDEWLLSSQHFENHQRSGIAYRQQRRMLAKVLRAADAVVATTQASADELARQVQESGSRASVHCIYNGYDEDDLTALRPESNPPERLRIVYTGTLWKLTDVSPVVDALIQLAAADPDSAARIDLIIAGRRTPHQDAQVGQLDATAVNVQRHDYLPHGKSLELAASADVLLLLLADEPGAERVVPAKLFEYLALRKPILAICGDGETASLIDQHGHTYRFSPGQPERIAACLSTLLAERPCRPTCIADDLGRFSRRRQTSQLAEVMDAVSR